MKQKQIEHLIHVLETKYHEELESPEWAEWEIEELSGILRNDIKEIMKVKKEVQETLNALYKQRDRL